jgi:hypothetical protein
LFYHYFTGKGLFGIFTQMKTFMDFLSSKFKKRKLIMLMTVFLILSGCLPFQAYIYIVPDQEDIHRFKHEVVKHDKKCYNFKHCITDKPIYITNWTAATPLIKIQLVDFLKQQEANNFLVIKNDSIVFEYTDEKITHYDPSPCFSIAKTFVSATLGVAIKEGYIGSVNDLAKKYLPELNYNENFDHLTINHLLNQSSGIKSTVKDISDAYYGKAEKVLKGLKFVAKPGEHLEYVNVNAVLLGFIVERATKRRLHEYFSEKIWSRIGTCDSAVWAFDYKTNHTRAFCCFGTSIRDYAKFGKLYLNKGKWNGEQIIDKKWVTASTSTVNATGEDVGYNNCWFIGEAESGDFMSVGMYRQQIYVNPKENVIIVSLMKFNRKNLPLRWWEILRQISKQA